MAGKEQNEPSLPISNNEKRSSADLLPRYYRTNSNRKFLSATLDQLTQPGTVKKLNGYLGRQNAKAVKSSDIFITAPDITRQNYQLEPGAVIQDNFENVTFYKDYIDFINQISAFGGNVDNHERLNQQEFYSWNPHINWDKFVNFQNYYWLPYGPESIAITGQQQEIDSTYTVSLVDEDDNFAYLLSPDGLTRNATITLYRGQTYDFDITSPDHPFSFKTVRSLGDIDRYTTGVSQNALTSGKITFAVPYDAPDVLFYSSEADPSIGGAIHILDIEENTFLDIDADIIGKQTYTTSTGITLSNGMKLQFEGNVTPTAYSTGDWYVEGVGTAIKLISAVDLEIIGAYTDEIELLFDDTGFDQDPFSTASAFPRQKDYVTINRASPDRNPWSRYNRWFHSDVIIASAQARGKTPEFDQTARANRSIIEFNAGIKLYNFGHQSKKNVDLVDTFTTDVFSTIEGAVGYNIDGVGVIDGMRILFTADTDKLVKNKIYKATFINVVTPNRQLSFDASLQVNPDTDVITFTSEHKFTNNSDAKVIYLNNGNESITGLSNRKIYYVLVVDSFRIKLFNDRLLTVPANIFAAGIGTHKFEVFSGLKRQINLVEDSDTNPILNETVLVKQGRINQGKMYWFDGTDWKVGQLKNSVSQPPTFDIFDKNGISFSDNTVYDSSTFSGTKLFSYKLGTSSVDTVLGFPLTYKNINNVGDIVFEFNLLNDSFNYKVLTDVKTKKTDVGFLKIISDLDNFKFSNGWVKSQITNVQPIIRIYKNSGLTNNFPIDVYDNQDDLDDLVIKVYKNGIKLPTDQYAVVTGVVRKAVRLVNNVTDADVITLKCYAAQSKNNNGYYEIPVNLQNNPLNNNLTEFTLGEVIDHVGTIVENITSFQGIFPGVSNLRDIADPSAYGTRFLQHSGPLNLSLYHFCQQNFNVFKALENSRADYGKFKRAFLVAASSSGIQTDDRRHVDYVLEQMAKDYPKTFPYYLTDMFAYRGATRLEYTVVDGRIKTYPLTDSFDLTNLSNKAVYVYLNETQLLYGRDYTFGTDIFFEILTTLTEGDTIEVFEFESTDGSFCPPTPTKLGLYPKFEPRKYIDDTYLEPREVIQGHDGSITLAYGDYRDDMLLELEKRIYNNIKVEYDPAIFDIYDFVPGYSRDTVYSKEEFEKVLSVCFFQWTTNINEDFTKILSWDRLNPFTFNYRENITPDGADSPAFWRGIYKWTLDTDRPHSHPWECLGFSIKPTWWEAVYGPAPYTKNNEILWDDIKQGIIREPGVAVRIASKFAKSILEFGVPVDEDGKLLDPLNANFVQGIIKATAEGYYEFGDYGPVESAWRRSSYYPFALIQAALLLQPNKVLASCLDRSRTIRTLDNQLVYKDTDLRIKLSDIVIPSTVNSATRVFTSGLINYIVDHVSNDLSVLIDNYKTDLTKLTNKIGSKLGGFTSKPKFKLLLDSKSPTSSGGVFVPEDNYNIFLNTSSPIKKLSYSGIIVTKYPDGFEVRGYNIQEPYFTFYPYRLNERVIRIGGISESYVTWTPERTYVAGKTISFNGQYYRAKTTHKSGLSFDTELYVKLAELPQTGGQEIIIRKAWDYNNPQILSYGTKFATVQAVADFIQGYAVYLEEQGFVFQEYNPNLKSISNWETSLKEFAFWTTQNWAEGSAISLSPAADTITINTGVAVVNDIKDPFYGYSVYRVDGQLLAPEFTNPVREAGQFSLTTEKTNHGIYGATFYLIQKEHVILIDNTTLFNDTIYDLEPGYRQERIKVLGYISSNWDGSFNVPGFVFDQAKITEWDLWTDYNLGDIVRYKEFYYSAKSFISGAEQFDSSAWTRLVEKPTSQLLPNWDYKSEQFTDFYDLDTDNFDREQQRLAQHLIGYQNRQYLENIIKDDVSQYKFYQGMITEKGTQNVLSKLFDVLSADNQDSLTFNEEWAVRVGEYGAVASFSEVEFKLDEKEFKLNPQPIELVTDIDRSLIDFVYRQRTSEVYVKPTSFISNFLPTTGRKRALRTPGHVRYSDVLVSVNTLSDAIALGIDAFKEGDYVWCAFENRDWNVFRFTKNTFRVEDVEYADEVLKITVDRIPDLVVGDIIGIAQSDTIKGFYTISSISNRNIIINTVIEGWEAPFADSTQIVTFKFTSNRITNIDDANDQLPPEIKNNELIWADDNGRGLLSVYANSKVYKRSEIPNNTQTLDLKFGIKLAMTKSGTDAAVATGNNEVILYNRASTLNEWSLYQTIVAQTAISSSSNIGFGLEIAFSDDGEWLAIAAPTASDVQSNWAGEFNNLTSYDVDDVVQVKNVHFSAKQEYDFITDGSSQYQVDRFSQDWETALLVEVNADKAPSGLANQGYVSVYKKAVSGRYVLQSTFVSPQPTANEQFGKNLAFSKQGDEYVLAVSSPGYNQNQGRVYLFRYVLANASIGLSAWKMDYDRNYQGIFDPAVRYYTDDIVFYNYELYRSLADQDPTAFETNPSAWGLITTEVPVFGFFPQEVVTEVADNDVIAFPTSGQTVESVLQGDLFGYDVKMTADGTYLVISAPAADQSSYKNYKGKFRSVERYDIGDVVNYNGAYYSYKLTFDSSVAGAFNAADWTLLTSNRISNTGKVFVYEYVESGYKLVDTLSGSNGVTNLTERFGESIAISSLGSYLAVGSTLADGTNANQGKVTIFESSTSLFTPHQDLYSTKAESNENFGAYVEFMNDDQTLVVLSTNGDIENFVTFDSLLTTFDSDTLRFVEKQYDTGRLDIFDRYNTKFVYGESLTSASTNDVTDKYGYSVAVGNNIILASAPYEDDITNNTGRIYSYIKPVNRLSWQNLYTESPTPNAYKIKKAYLYNKITSQLVSYLDIVDPIQGKIPGPADQEIKFKTYFDPATYSIGTSDVNVDEGMNWTNRHIGMLWWDLTTAKFLEFGVGETVYRSTTWNTLHKNASIDIYEWTESKYLPSEWDALSGTAEGFSEGISGITKYGNSVYSIKQKYDTVSRSFINTYYFWVKAPSILPNAEGRILTADNVARLIADPVGYGYPCIALTAPNTFSLVNVSRLIEDTAVVLNLQYWLVEDQTKNYHSQWKVISEHPNTIIPHEIETKWIDSLIGKDQNNRLLPDLKVPVKLRYGIENRPRQTMFVNRVEALKQTIERVNSVLLSTLIADDFDLSDLNLSESAPSLITGKWDQQIDLTAELRFIGTASLRQARLSPVIIDGRIVDIDILDAGNGYINAPYLTVIGTGSGAEFRTVLDESGRVIDVNVINTGSGYDANTLVSVRAYSVLVVSDDTSLDSWAIYAWDRVSRTWNKTKNQTYNVTNFWNYVDWYSTGYDQFTKINHVVDNTYQLATLETDIGSIVKVKNIGAGGWILLEKYNNIVTIDYTQNYKVIARQNGTIKFDKSLYTFKDTILGFDGALFDSARFDNSPTQELRIILDTIKNKIFIDNLRTEYLKLFFASLRYALSEQLFIDWAFKTSFVKATHNAGELTQKVSYNSDNLEDFENYVNEVKPYRTKVREYVSAYSKLDTAGSAVTDFDLVPAIDVDLKISPIDVKVDEFGIVQSLFTGLDTYPWKFWKDNLGFNVDAIEIVDGGSGYISSPQVRFVGGFGSGAEAKAYISNGKLNRIELINSGTGYLSAPMILIDGGLSATGVQAKAVAIIDNSVVRSNKITVKFDRITRSYYVVNLEETETFTGSGSRVQFALRFSPNATVGSSKVTVNGIDSLRDDYTLSSKKSTSKGYTSYSGLLTFDTAPATGDVISITYEKNFNHLSAADRINFYYNPQTGQLGKDLAQLMNGIDFGGVNVTGLGFITNGGWDSLPWYSEGWDGFDAEFDDYIVTVTDSTYAFTLPFVPALNEEINVYVNGQRIDDPYFDSYDGITVQPNGRKIAPANTYMQTWVGDGVTQVIELPNLTNTPPLDIDTGDKIIFRRSTSDGSFNPDESAYDTQLSGGNFALGNLATATGFSPDDIILDGQGFVTPEHSHAPEEIVPGHISDAVAIKMFRLPVSGTSTIFFKNYICDGVNATFSISQFVYTDRSVFVKLDNAILQQDIDYTLDWANKTITLTTAPDDKKILSVASFSVGSLNILDVDNFVSDGSTIEYVTNAPWPTLAIDFTQEDGNARVGSVVLVNGQAVNYELFETDDSYQSAHVVGIRFAVAPAENIVINYVITADANQSISLIKSEPINVDGSTLTYTLTNLVGNTEPYANNILVIKNGTVLTPSDTVYFTLADGELSYQIPPYKALPFSLDTANIKVTIDGNVLTILDYTLDQATQTVTLSNSVYVDGSILSIANFTDADYFISGSTLIFDAMPLNTDTVEVVSFYNHDVQQIVRTNERFDLEAAVTPGSFYYFRFMSMKGGELRLFRTVPKDDYVWVVKNKQLLSHSIDFFLDTDLRTIRFAQPLLSSDKIDVILFGDNNVSKGYGFMQFKDMLNRVHYKRINKAKSTILVRDLGQKDAVVYVQDGSVLSEPNKLQNLPGIIEINGERIEYFVKTGNTLTQLRRGTLGTGVPFAHRVQSYVLDLGTTETVPYADQHIVQTFVAGENTTSVSLNYTPTSVNEIDVFVGGYRLKKTDYSIFGKFDLQGDLVDPDYPDSPEGDITLPAEFSVNGSNVVSLTNEPTPDTKIVVIKKIGKIWEDPSDPTEVFRNISAAYGGATFDIVKNVSQYFLTLTNGGTGYVIGNIIVLPGALLGGRSPVNDITITVTEISTDSTASLVGFTYTGLGQDNGFTAKPLVESDNKIANFLKNTETIWPQYLVDKYSYVLLTEDGQSILTESGDPLELD